MWRAQEDMEVVVEQHPCEDPPIPALSHPREHGDPCASARVVSHDGTAIQPTATHTWYRPLGTSVRNALAILRRDHSARLAPRQPTTHFPDVLPTRQCAHRRRLAA